MRSEFLACESASKFGSDALLVTIDHAGPMTRAWRRSSFPRPYIWRLTSLSLQIWPSAWPLDQPEESAEVTAPFVFRDALANAATGLVLARSIQGSSSAGAFLPTIAWKFVTTSLASTKSSTPLSIAATVYSLGLGKLVAPDRHQPGDGSCRGPSARSRCQWPDRRRF
jgi:hypothetical protein